MVLRVPLLMHSTVSLPPSFAPAPRFSRNAVIVGSVLVFHGAALWALQSGLVRQAIEIIVPVEMLAEMVEPPKPKPPPPAPLAPVKPQVVKTKAPTPPPVPRPMAIADPTPAPNAPTGVTTHGCIRRSQFSDHSRSTSCHSSFE